MVCWRCGTTPDGERDPEFQITEPVDDESDPGNDSLANLPLFPPRLPNIIYYYIPIYLWVHLLFSVHLSSWAMGDRSQAPLTPIEFWLLVFASLPIAIPIFGNHIAQSFLELTGIRQTRQPIFSEFAGLLKMFLLPESIRRSQPWFTWVYYGSIVAHCVGGAALTVILWQTPESMAVGKW